MLFGLAFSNNNANTAACNHNNNGQITVQSSSNPGEGVDPGGSDTGGDTGQIPPKK
ncbi:hypothetical protein ABEG63_05685 [Chryseobacterium sp. C39-AII1]|uniref:hypothetical protein n=1 Tax=Chryseobacterium sp. C39-AII1 TaxID=3080332 RepID=UPI00320B1707